MKLPLLLLSLTSLLAAAEPVHYQQAVLGQQLELKLDGIAAANWRAELPKLQIWLKEQQTLLGSTELNAQRLELVQACEAWFQFSQQSYSCRLGSIEQQWHQAVQSQQLPDRVELRRQARTLLRLQLTAPEYSHDAVQWQLTGLARARLLDLLQQQLKSLWPALSAMDIQLGVNRLLWSAQGNTLLSLGKEQALLQQLDLPSVALAQTEHQGGYSLSYRTFSPVLQPSEGWPVEYGPVATVVAKDAVNAYLLAQSLAVLELKQGQQLADQQGAAALVKTDSGDWYASASWYDYLADKSQSQQQALQISYQLPKFSDDNYKRPYVSVWLTDQQKKPVRQLSLVGQQSRWYQELSHWWRRLGRTNPEQIDQIAGATQKPGIYQLQWDGRDQQGAVVPWGQYQLHLEVAREHGGHEHLTLPLNWQADLKPVEQLGKAELGLVRLQIQSKNG
jgi:FAD:protein FMN transferase